MSLKILVPLLKILSISEYPNGQKIKVKWNPIMCSYTDLIYTLWVRLTGGETQESDSILEMLKIPKVGRKVSHNVSVRIELSGYTLVKGDSIRNLSNDRFKVNFFYEFKHEDMAKNKISDLQQDFLNFANKKLTNELAKLEVGSSEICKFNSIYTDISIKTVKKPRYCKG